MVVQDIHIDELISYVSAALDGDDDIVFYYDKKQKVKTIEEACDNIVWKIKTSYPFSEMRGIKINGSKVGYFVYVGELLISFSLNKNYRNKVILCDMWDHMTKELGGDFQCLLYSYNIRAIDFLKRNGMKVVFENTTLLKFENNIK